MKRKIAILLAALMVLSMLAACSAPAQNSGAPDANKAEEKPVVIQIGYENNPGEPTDLAVNEWKRLLEEKSNGTMKMEVFPSSQLGSKNDIIDQMLAGSAVITLADGAFYADRGVPDFGITFGPYLFESWDDTWKLTESNWWADQSGMLEDKGLKILTANRM